MIITAILYGAFAALVFRATTSPRRLRETTNQILARIMEFRLFVDEPSLVWRAQVGVLRANLALVRQIALPCLIMAILFALICAPMNHRFGDAPLKSGESAVMTGHTDNIPHIDGVEIETSGVRVPRTGEVSWRIRAVHPVIGHLPPGFEIQYPRTAAWLLWFFAISSVSALILARTI